MSEEPNTLTAHRSAAALSRLPIGAAVEAVLLSADITAPASGTERSPDTGIDGALERLGPLPIAPRRWLWLGLDAEEVSRAVGDRAHVVDVEGKWAVFRCEDSVARQPLSSVVDIDTVLEPRACATLTLFDCPAVLLRAGGEGYVICVHSSYAASFEAAFRAALDASGGAARPGDSDGAVRMSDNSGGFG